MQVLAVLEQSVAGAARLGLGVASSTRRAPILLPSGVWGRRAILTLKLCVAELRSEIATDCLTTSIDF